MKYELVCTKCSKHYTEKDKAYWCECGEKLDVLMNLADLPLNREELIRREVSQLPIIEKYFELLPLHNREIIDLGEGGTHMLKSKRLAQHTGLKNLYIKNETTNPTGSFKDRPITVGLNKAIEHGASTVATASSGNAATSLAAGAAKAGLRCIAFVPEGIPGSKAAQLQFYGAEVYRCKKTSDEDPTAACLKEICQQREDVIPVPSFGNFNPYQIEGAKTMAYEIAEQYLPQHVVIPVGGAGLLLGTWKGFSEFHTLGIIDKMPRIHAVQAEGCAPLVRSFRESQPIRTWEKAGTVANGLADPYTWDGDVALVGVRATEGRALAVNDAAILEAQRALAKYEGIFAEPTGAVSLAGALALAEQGIIGKDESVCVPITGSGFKDLGVVEKGFAEPRLISSISEINF